jgi:hypothetical protein
MTKNATEKKILYKYEVTVYDDGTAEIRHVSVPDSKKECPSSKSRQKEDDSKTRISVKIQHTLTVLGYIRDNFKTEKYKSIEYPRLAIKFASIDAISRAAAVHCCSKNTIRDKFTRQMNLSILDWENLLYKWQVENNADDLRRLLLQNITHGRNSAAVADIDAINAFFDSEPGAE